MICVTVFPLLSTVDFKFILFLTSITLFKNAILYKTNKHMIITTTETIPGKEIISILEIARGNAVRSRNVGSDIIAGLKSLIGGELGEYTKLQADAREQALQRLKQDAERLGADAVVSMRITTSMIAAGSAEISAYGTAVKLK